MKWIKCSERMPDDYSKQYLWWTVSGNIFAEYIAIAIQISEKREEYRVTHWAEIVPPEDE